MQHHTADQLNVEVTHFVHALTGFAANGKGFRQQTVECFTFGKTRFEFRRFCLQCRIRQGFHLWFQCVDLTHGFLVLLQEPLVTAAEYLGQE